MKVTTSIEIPSEKYTEFAEGYADLIEQLFADRPMIPPFEIRHTSAFKMREPMSRQHWLEAKDEILASMGAETPMERALRGGGLELVASGPLGERRDES
jgi:hypothetical protein